MRQSPLYPILFMAAISALCGAAISSVAVATRSRVEAGAQLRDRGTILTAAGLEVPRDAEAVAALWERIVEERRDGAGPYYTVRGADRNVRAQVFPFQGPGFWGPIEGVVAVDPRAQTIVGVAFTRHQETPGLGGRITEPWFRAQFRGKSIAPAAAGQAVLQFVLGQPEGPRQVEAITGATQTSTRLETFLNPFLAGLQQRPALARGAEP